LQIPSTLILSTVPIKVYSFSAIPAFFEIESSFIKRIRNLDEVHQYITDSMDIFKKVVIQAFIKGYSYKFLKELRQNKWKQIQVEIITTIMNDMKKHNIIVSSKEVFMVVRKSYSNFMYYLKERI
jgi:hypothetical protein